MPVFREIPKSSIKPGMADVYEVEYSTTQVVANDMTAMMKPLYHSVQVIGFPFSFSSSKSTSKAGSVVAVVAVLLFVRVRVR